MRKKRKIKLAYKIIGVHLINFIILVLCVLLFAREGIKIIEGKFYEKYCSNAEKSMEVLDEELLQLKYIISYVMQSDNVLMLRERKEHLSAYETIQYKIGAKEEMTILANQYRFIKNMGIYLPEYDLWIDVAEWFLKKEPPKARAGDRLEVRDGGLYLSFGSKSLPYQECYIKLDQEEMDNLLQRMKFDDKTEAEFLIDGMVWGDAVPDTVKQGDYRLVTVKSKLYPLEIHLYTHSSLLSFERYLYILGAISLVVLLATTILFARYLNSAIHVPLQNVVNHIDGLNEENYNSQLQHQGVDEFMYVTLKFNRMKLMLEDYIKKSYEQDIAMKQMELDHLQEQIKPHFLYNCFFNITNLCKTYDVEKVEKLTLALARYYRYITRTGQNLVTLKEEYNHMQDYILVQKIRFEDRVDMEMDQLPECVWDVMVSRLILQPIVENAYKYVFEQVEGNAHLKICVGVLDSKVRISVEDSGCADNKESLDKALRALNTQNNTITGLGNLQKRMKYLNDENGIAVEKSSLGGLKITLYIYIGA